MAHYRFEVPQFLPTAGTGRLGLSLRNSKIFRSPRIRMALMRARPMEMLVAHGHRHGTILDHTR